MALNERGMLRSWAPLVHWAAQSLMPTGSHPGRKHSLASVPPSQGTFGGKSQIQPSWLSTAEKDPGSLISAFVGVSVV